MLQDVEMKDINNEKQSPILSKSKNSSLPFIEKYRPSQISNIISHDEIINTLNTIKDELQILANNGKSKDGLSENDPMNFERMKSKKPVALLQQVFLRHDQSFILRCILLS